jgi:hypothetical protein
MSTVGCQIENENWMITPAALAVNEIPPTSISDQKWLLALSGVAVIFEDNTQGMAGNSVHDWRRTTLVLHPDFFAPLTYAIDKYAIPRLGQGTHFPVLSLEPGGWAPFAAISSVLHAPPDYDQYDEDPTPQNATALGVAVDRWRPNHFLQSTDMFGLPIPNVFTGIAVDVAVYGSATLYRVSYQATLVGKIAFGNPAYPPLSRAHGRRTDSTAIG